MARTQKSRVYKPRKRINRTFETLEDRRMLAYIPQLTSTVSAEIQALSSQTITSLPTPPEPIDRDSEVPEEYNGKIGYGDWRALADVQEGVAQPSRSVSVDKFGRILIEVRVSAINEANLDALKDLVTTVTGPGITSSVVEVSIEPNRVARLTALDFVVSLRLSSPAVSRNDAPSNISREEFEREIRKQFRLPADTTSEEIAALLAPLEAGGKDRADEIPTEFRGKISFNDWQTLVDVQQSPSEIANSWRVALHRDGRISINTRLANVDEVSLKSLEDLGATIIGFIESRVAIRIAPDRVADLANLDVVLSIKIPMAAVTRTGAIKSAADAILLADQARLTDMDGSDVMSAGEDNGIANELLVKLIVDEALDHVRQKGVISLRRAFFDQYDGQNAYYRPFRGLLQ